MVDNLGIYNSEANSEYDLNKHIQQGLEFKQFGQDSDSEDEYKLLQVSTASEWGSIVDTFNDENSTQTKGIIEGMSMSQNQVNFNNMVSQYARDYKTYVSTYLNTLPQPQNVRYIRITPNANGDFIQISKFVVNAFVNGSLINVAPRGTCTAANAYRGTAANNPIKVNGGNYYSASASRNNWWQLDLGQDYNVAEVIYFNREGGLQKRALGMQIQLKAKNGTVHQPITLTAGLKQVFNASTNPATFKPTSIIDLGCWKESNKIRALNNYKGRVSNVNECTKKAIADGATIFATQYGGECWLPRAGDKYDKYGKKTGPCPPLGGPWTNHVYKVESAYDRNRKAAEASLLIQKNNILTAANRINNDVKLSNATRAKLLNAFHGTEQNMRFNLNELDKSKKKIKEISDKYDLESINGAMETTELNMTSMYYHVFVYMAIVITLIAFIFNLMVNPNANVLNAIYVLVALSMVYIVSKYFVN
jgi:hypothetical protein